MFFSFLHCLAVFGVFVGRLLDAMRSHFLAFLGRFVGRLFGNVFGIFWQFWAFFGSCWPCLADLAFFGNCGAFCDVCWFCGVFFQIWFVSLWQLRVRRDDMCSLEGWPHGGHTGP